MKKNPKLKPKKKVRSDRRKIKNGPIKNARNKIYDR